MIQRGVLADSTPLYASVDPSDQYYARADGEAMSIARQQLETVIPAPILGEVHSLILYRLGLAIARRLLEEMFNSAAIANPSQIDYRTALRIIQQYEDQPITLTDAVVAAMSQRLQLPVWTYDHHFDIMQVRVWRGP